MRGVPFADMLKLPKPTGVDTVVRRPAVADPCARVGRLCLEAAGARTSNAPLDLSFVTGERLLCKFDSGNPATGLIRCVVCTCYSRQ